MAAGYFLFLVYGRLRYSDGQRITAMHLDVDGLTDSNDGFLECVAERTKTQTGLAKKRKAACCHSGSIRMVGGSAPDGLGCFRAEHHGAPSSGSGNRGQVDALAATGQRSCSVVKELAGGLSHHGRYQGRDAQLRRRYFRGVPRRAWATGRASCWDIMFRGPTGLWSFILAMSLRVP